MRYSALLAAMAILLSMTSPAPAAVTFFTNGTGLESPATVISFSEGSLANGTPVTNQFSSYGVGFVNAWLDTTYTYTPTPSLTSFDFASCTCYDLEILFTTPMDSAAWQLVTNAGLTMIEAYLGGSLVGSTSVATSTVSPIPYYGFTGGLVDRIVLRAPVNQAALIDNLQLNGAAVPEPATWAMMLLGFGAVGFAMRRLHNSIPQLA